MFLEYDVCTITVSDIINFWSEMLKKESKKERKTRITHVNTITLQHIFLDYISQEHIKLLFHC